VIILSIHIFYITSTGFILIIFVTKKSFGFRVDPVAFASNDPFKKISITYDDHWFVICLSNKKIYIVKRTIPLTITEGNTVNV
jgi:hypothetical protein